MPRTAAVRKPKPAAAATAAAFPIPALKPGEAYAGVILKDGVPTHHLVLLPGDECKPWKDAVAWAKDQGGELPTRKEQALLFANCGALFKQDWYWSGETHARNADYAWVQSFDLGGQDVARKSYALRCRAVRRVAI